MLCMYIKARTQCLAAVYNWGMGFFDDIVGIVSDFNDIKEEAKSTVTELRDEALGLKDEAIQTVDQLKAEALELKDEAIAAGKGLQDEAAGLKGELLSSANGLQQGATGQLSTDDIADQSNQA